MEPGAPAGSSQTSMDHAAGPSQRPVEPTAGPSWRNVEPTAGPSWRNVEPTAGPSRRPVEPIAGPSRRSMAPTAGPSSSFTSRYGVTVRIIEQPANKAPKFRYESENRIPEPILGASSTRDQRTYPAIEVFGYKGKATIVVSCVTKNAPYRPHPHKLAGHGYKRPDGLFVMDEVDITPENRVVTFSNIGIVCVKKNGIANSLDLRKCSKIDPFHTGFDHGASMTTDLNAVRLCFQVYVERGNKFDVLTIVSNIVNKFNLTIIDHSCICGSAVGGTKVVLICDKMDPKDVEVTLYSEEAAWSVIVPRNCVTFYHNVAIAFHTPPYRDPATRSTITACIQLRRRSTEETSNSVHFTYEPSEDPGADYIERKRKKPLQKELIETLQSIPQPPPQAPYDDDLRMDPYGDENVQLASEDPTPMWQSLYQPVLDGISHPVDLNPNEPNSDFSIDELSNSGEWNPGVVTAMIETLEPIEELTGSLSHLLNETDNSDLE